MVSFVIRLFLTTEPIGSNRVIYFFICQKGYIDAISHCVLTIVPWKAILISPFKIEKLWLKFNHPSVREIHLFSN